jgi:glycosyltransferase involved in cell wall biosynthesis
MEQSPPISSQARERPSVLIITRDEEINIAECIASVSAFSDDIVVLDSYSTDRTVQIAESFPNVRIVLRAFDTEYVQRNFGLHEIEYRHPWVYVCDADERVPEDLAKELVAVCNDATTPHAAYRLRYKNIYLGRWIRYASSYPTWIIRLVRPNQVSYEIRETNVHPIVEGSIGELNGHFVHYSYNAGLDRWFSKHNFYSTREALEGVKIRKLGRPSLRSLKHKDPIWRRRQWKNWSYFLVGRGVFRFLLQYVLRGGFLDGRAGFHYCVMISMYEYWIEVKMKELESDWAAATDRAVERLLAEDGPMRSRKRVPRPGGVVSPADHVPAVVEAKS